MARGSVDCVSGGQHPGVRRLLDRGRSGNEQGSWPSRGELFRASLVVIVVIFLLTAILFAYDVVLKFIVGKLLGGGGDDAG